jgi:hypothetical protein
MREVMPMGKRGPAAKPTKLRVLHGDRADRINADEPEPPEDEIRCPDWASDIATSTANAKGP